MKRFYCIQAEIFIDASSPEEAIKKVDSFLSEGWISGDSESSIGEVKLLSLSAVCLHRQKADRCAEGGK